MSEQTNHSLGTRGQTSIDLVLAVLLFFSAVGFVLLNSSALFLPGDYTQPNDEFVADSIAEEITEKHLSEYGTVGITDTKISEFETEIMEGNGELVELQDKFDLSSEVSIQVSISPSYHDELPSLDGGELILGGNPPDGENLTVATRSTTLEQHPTTVTVAIWRE